MAAEAILLLGCFLHIFLIKIRQNADSFSVNHLFSHRRKLLKNFSYPIKTFRLLGYYCYRDSDERRP